MIHALRKALAHKLYGSEYVKTYLPGNGTQHLPSSIGPFTEKEMNGCDSNKFFMIFDTNK